MMPEQKKTLLCLALVAIGGVAVGALVLDALPEEVTIEYSVLYGPQGDEYVAWYTFWVEDAPRGTEIWYKCTADTSWHRSICPTINDKITVKNTGSNEAEALSLEFYGKLDGYKFTFARR